MAVIINASVKYLGIVLSKSPWIATYIPEWSRKEKLWKCYVIHKQYDFIRKIVDNLKENAII